MAARSPVFAAMFKSNLKESIENQVIITDSSFEIIEKAVKLCYHRNLVSDISNDDAIAILTFADKYDIAVVRDNLELYLGDQLSTSNISDLVTYAVETNALNLQKKCIEFLADCTSKKEIIRHMNEFCEKYISFVHDILVYRKCETL
uniref:BTB domain-containing protein n=1 Tax=Panagrolaimus sp. ES5 TaxID=591445 RepID=A0AC34FGK9_9BILA